MAEIRDAVTLALKLNAAAFKSGLKQAAQAGFDFASKSGQAAQKSANGFNKAFNGVAGKGKKTFKDTGNEAKKFGDKAKKAGNKARDAFGRFVKGGKKAESTAKRVTSSVGKMAKSVAGFVATLGGLAILKNSVEDAREFDKAMREVTTIVPQGEGTLKSLSEQVRQVSLEMGIDATEAAKAMYQAISAGVPANKALGFLRSSAKLAVGGVSQLDESVDLLTNVLAAYGLELDKTTPLSDALFKTVQLGKTTIPELSAALGKVAPIANKFGVSLTEMLGSLAATTPFQKTAEAVTGLRAVLVGVSRSTREAKKEAKRLGFDFSLSALQAKGFAGFMDELREKTNGSTESISKLFRSVEAKNTVLALAGAQAGDFARKTAAIGNAAGITEQAFNKMADGIDFKMSTIEAAAKQTSESFGKSALDMLFNMGKTGDGIDSVALQMKALGKQAEVGFGFIVLGAQLVSDQLKFLFDIGSGVFKGLKSGWEAFTDSIKVNGKILELVSLKLERLFDNIAFNRAFDRAKTQEEEQKIFNARVKKLAQLKRKEFQLRDAITLGQLKIKKGIEGIVDETKKGFNSAVKNFKANTQESLKTWDKVTSRAREANKLWAKAGKAADKFRASQVKAASVAPGGDVSKALTPQSQVIAQQDAQERKTQQEIAKKLAEAVARSRAPKDATTEKLRQAVARSKAPSKVMGAKMSEALQKAPKGFERITRIVRGQLQTFWQETADVAIERANKEVERIREGVAFRRKQLGSPSERGSTALKKPPLPAPINLTFSSENQGLKSFFKSARAFDQRTPGVGNARELTLQLAKDVAAKTGESLASLLKGVFNQGFASGGTVTGRGFKDSVPAVLTPGERVLTPRQNAMLTPALQRIERNDSQGTPGISNQFGDINFSFQSENRITVEEIDSMVVPRLKFLQKMGRL